MKKIEIQRETVVPLNDADIGQVNGGTTNICATARVTTAMTRYTTSRNTCMTLHTCKWSGITTQKCG